MVSALPKIVLSRSQPADAAAGGFVAIAHTVRVRTFAVGTAIARRPPGHRRRSPTSGSHRTWRAALPHHALRQLIHSTAFAAICSSFVAMVS
jgi:hypothetical protein